MSDSRALLSQAWQDYEGGQLSQAEESCLRIIKTDGNLGEALRLLALVAHRTGRSTMALDYLHQAVMSQPTDAHNYFYVAVAYSSMGQPEQAIHSYRQALRFQPDLPEAHNNLATALQGCGRLEEAVIHLQHALALRPNYANAYLNLGTIRQAQGRLDEAIACYQSVLRLRPDSAEAYCNLGATLQAQGKLDEAAGSYQAALQLRPDTVQAVYNLGHVLQEQRKLEDASACYRQALQLRPDHVDAQLNLGVIRSDQGRDQEALDHFQRALGLRPEHAGALNNLGLLLHRQGRLNESLRHYEKALQVAPESAEAHFGRAEVLLLVGDFEQGWAEYEWRWRQERHQSRPAHKPAWDGSPLQGRTILLHAEQGLGDTLQFVRYAPLVKQCGGKVLVQCQPELASLVTTCPGIDQVVTGEPLPAFDVQAALLSLPHVLRTSLATIPAHIPYLTADPTRVEHWRQELSRERPGFRVGLVWQGNPRRSNPRHEAADRRRSVSLMQFAPLADVPGVSLFGLQVGAGCEQWTAADFPITDLGTRFDPASLADLAAVLTNLDLFITVDTAPAHLAGALGVPVWIALPWMGCWRWLLDRQDSPWYPTARLYRQPREGDWDSVVKQMVQALQEMSGALPA